MKHVFFISFLVIQLYTSYSQIQIWLNDGFILETANYRIDTSNQQLFYLNKKFKVKNIEQSIVFAIIDKNDTIVFQQPSNMTITQSFHFLKGVNEGYKYKNFSILLSNFGLGLSSSFFLPQIGFSGVYSFMPNIISTIAFGSINVKDKNIPIQNTYYQKGYKISSKKKKLLLATEASLAGLITGSLILYLLKN